jgi:hypothetical protein
VGVSKADKRDGEHLGIYREGETLRDWTGGPKVGDGEQPRRQPRSTCKMVGFCSPGRLRPSLFGRTSLSAFLLPRDPNSDFSKTRTLSVSSKSAQNQTETPAPLVPCKGCKKLK